MKELRTILVEFKYFPKYSLQETGRRCVGSLPKLSVEASLICLMKDTSPEDFGRCNQFNCQAVFM